MAFFDSWLTDARPTEALPTGPSAPARRSRHTAAYALPGGGPRTWAMTRAPGQPGA